MVESGRRFRASRDAVQSPQDELRRAVAQAVRGAGGYFVTDAILEAGADTRTARNERRTSSEIDAFAAYPDRLALSTRPRER